MFAATRFSDDSLGLLKAILGTISSQEGQVPAQMRSYLLHVLTAAADLSVHRSAAIQNYSGEVVELALDMASDEDLRTTVLAIDEYDKVTADRAKHLLARLESASAT